MKYILIILLFVISISHSQTPTPITYIPDSLAYKSILVGARVDVDILKSRFESPFFVSSYDFDGSVTLISRQKEKTYYHENIRIPVRVITQIYVKVQYMRIISKKLEIIDISLR